MSKYDGLFDDVAARDSVFADKGALDPLAEPEEVVARDDQERQLAGILSGVHEGDLPTTVSLYGPSGTGKMLTTLRLFRAFAARHADFGSEYVNLKECRTLFSAANEILFEVAGEKKGAYAGLDGVFEAIWTALEDYPEWTVLILDEIDHGRRDSNYDPSEFFYRLLRGEGKLKRGLHLSVFLVSNELLEVDLRLDSRVRSAMSDEAVFFPPYGVAERGAIVGPRVERAFVDGAMPETVRRYGVEQAAQRWGDARRALTLFRQAGELANDRGLAAVTRECIDDALAATEGAAVQDKLASLPLQHFVILDLIADRLAATIERDHEGVTVEEVQQRYRAGGLPADVQVGERAVRDVISDLETMGFVESWIESRGRHGRKKLVDLTFDEEALDEVREEYATRITARSE